MPAKTPMYLKTSTPKRGKKLKLRDVLSSDMISPPLGDFRHSAHVGPEGEGDMFGDVGFLQGKLDMLPALKRPHSRSHSIERKLDEAFPVDGKTVHHQYHHRHPHSSATLLKSTISMPVFVAPEQAPPKPPRLHLEDSPPLSQQQPQQQHQPQQQQRSMSVSEESGQRGGCHEEPCRDFSYSMSIPVFRHLVPSTGSFSEASSEDSMLDGCLPLDPHRGLSLDSDAGLSNEDLHSERSESPGVSNSESLVGLDIDLGPSILEDVLRIMDRYKTPEEGCEL
ncbi:cdc42 effector protein 3-like [Scleropages formosus]|uniref:Cdc42 effector protein 3-like n=1 Tax=Scleropages formosus TaxID=113540 RepID=A0A0P7XB27_SCLFO|nr:cdc42 effector protein 2-like [Scleropages formosus]XP_018598157.1 cdc42 effector protein 2-like [Scleropages formosus]XP_018598158.1 cdc42 effector protein 2-like [Scleropages formosus]KPP72040.1 cdc42 effector protein 3-like [Scleropages formosus]